MGEHCSIRAGKDDNEYFAEHRACPWYTWHLKEGCAHQDRMGCDSWLKAVVEGINEALGTGLKFETIHSMPDGDEMCLRRFYVE
jgi:hypothetical protein